MYRKNHYVKRKGNIKIHGWVLHLGVSNTASYQFPARLSSSSLRENLVMAPARSCLLSNVTKSLSISENLADSSHFFMWIFLTLLEFTESSFVFPTNTYPPKP